MGLNMYLCVRLYTGKYFNKELNEKFSNIIKPIIPLEIDGIDIKIEVGYWRKANHIHYWFVKNLNDEIDDCTDIYVPKEKLKELLDICKSVIELPISDRENKAKELLPVKDGFFFGGLEYDEYYIKDIEYTIKVIEQILSLPEDLHFDIIYRASW